VRVMATNSGVDVSKQLPASGIGMHRCRTPEGLRLYSSLSITTKDLARLAMRCTSARSEGSTPWYLVEVLVAPVLREWSLVNPHCLTLVHRGCFSFCFHGLDLVRRVVPVRGLGSQGAQFLWILETN